MVRTLVSFALFTALFGNFCSAVSTDNGTLIAPVEIVPTNNLSTSILSSSLLRRAISSSDAVAMLTLVNNLRSSVGVKTLQLDSRFMSVSQDQANYQAQYCTLTHSGYAGGLASRVLSITGLSNLYLGENVASGYSSVTSVFNAWKASAAHYPNLVNSNYNVMGIAVNQVSCGIYWSQDFGVLPLRKRLLPHRKRLLPPLPQQKQPQKQPLQRPRVRQQYPPILANGSSALVQANA
ncbi:hypothetical protein HK096_007639 [Nowakowskiella sp. JEL0078]|nr:hypothetical protein HK096_007639 [Nowakowskiella sp. JEL0078]